MSEQILKQVMNKQNSRHPKYVIANNKTL